MTNGEKYNTAQDRAEAYKDWRQSEGVFHALLADCIKEAFAWLDLEADEENPLPCPFCESRTRLEDCAIGKNVRCTFCHYESQDYALASDAIAAHNRVAKAAKDAKGDK